VDERPLDEQSLEEALPEERLSNQDRSPGDRTEQPAPGRGRARDETIGYYRLEVVAERVGLSPARIRAYEAAGLIRPARVQGRTRLYGESELARLRRFRRLAEHLGLNPAGVEVVARLLDEMAALRAELERLRGG
jgi:MerR family transcriptional regulator/heat shock protein HspR